MNRLPFAALALLCAGAVHGQDGIENIGTLGGALSSARAVSADGAMVVGSAYNAGGFERAFLWTSGGGMVDLGTLGGMSSTAYGVSADGTVVVGRAHNGGSSHAFRWTLAGGMVDLGTLGGSTSWAYGVSADGTTVVGESNLAFAGPMAATFNAFLWTSGGGMVNLGTLGGTNSTAYGVSADGAVVVGFSDIAGDATYHAYRWTSGGGMVDLGTLGGDISYASGVSANGAVVAGAAQTAGNAAYRAFSWTQAGGMVDLGTLGGTNSEGYGISADGAVVVGTSHLAGDATLRAFRWSQATGMQSVEDWLRAAGVSVPADITDNARAANSDGSVVVGQLANGHAFVARVAAVGSGLVTLADVQESLGGAATAGQMALRSGALLLNGAHGRPLSRRVGAGQKTFWLAGDWGADDHGSRSGDIGLAEAGLGKNLGPVQINVSLGQTWARQNLVLDGRARADGTYLLAEALVPVAGNLWAVLGAHGHRGQADLRRGYLNAGAQDYSTAKPDVDTWGLRARLEWDRARRLAGADFSPYLDLTYSEAKLDGYTETGGGFPARFDRRKDKATELRVGVNADRPLANGLNLVGTLEAAHRFEKRGARTSGEVLGLFGFALDGQSNKQDWLRAGVGVEGQLAGGGASLTLNATTRGEAPNVWLAANWQRAF